MVQMYIYVVIQIQIRKMYFDVFAEFVCCCGCEWL